MALFAAVHMSLFGRYCCKSLFALPTKILRSAVVQRCDSSELVREPILLLARIAVDRTEEVVKILIDRGFWQNPDCMGDGPFRGWMILPISSPSEIGSRIIVSPAFTSESRHYPRSAAPAAPSRP